MKLLYELSILLRKPVVKLVNKPTPITFIGEGQSKKTGTILKTAGSKKTFIITDSFLRKIGLIDGIVKSIKENELEYEIYDGVTPDPSFKVVEDALAKYKGCDSIVAIGGGSVIDTAKAVGAVASNGKKAHKMVGMLKVRRKLPPFIAVPTTAGTGSETTVAAVISDSTTHSKKQILDPKVVPAAAILDPTLTVGLPAHITAHTALDTLTHALEAYVSGYADSKTDMHAESSIKLVYENLDNVLKNPEDIAAREALLTASFLGGMAFTQTYVGYVHAFAHTLGAMFHIPHGLANAVLLPHVMEYYLSKCKNEFSYLAKVTGQFEDNLGIDKNAEIFIKSLFDLNKKAKIPERFDNFPESSINEVIKKAFRECHGIYPIPKYFTKKEAVKLLKKVCV